MVKLGFAADSRPLDKIVQQLDSLNGKLRLIAGVEVIKSLAHLMEGFGHTSLELLNTASAAGLTSDAMQGLQYAVTQAGGNAGELGMTMTHIAREMEGARLGAQDALETFYQLGISQQQIASFHTTEDALYGIMGALQKIHDPIRRQALMDRALGQGSRALGRFALNGESAARSSEDFAKRLGVIIPNATLVRLGEGRNAVMSLGLVVKSISASLAGGFAPAMVQAVHGVQEFYLANKQLIDVGIGKFIEYATYGFGELYAIVYIVARAFTQFIAKHQKLVKLAEDWAPALLSVAAALPLVNVALGVFETVGGAALAIFTAFSAEAAGFAIVIGSAVAALTLFMVSLFSFGQVVNKHGIKGLFNADNWKDTALFKGLDAMKAGIEDAKRLGGVVRGIWGEFGDGALVPSEGLANQDPTSRYGTPMSLLSPRAPSLLERLDAASYAQSAPPKFLAGSPTYRSSNMSLAPQMTTNVVVNVPAGMTPEQAQSMVTSGVRDAHASSYDYALNQFNTPFDY